MHVVPIYHLRTWKLTAADGKRIHYRPTWRTFVLRLRWTLVAGFFLVALLYATQSFRKPTAVPALTPKERAFAAEGEQAARDLLRDQTATKEYERISEDLEAQRAARAADDAAWMKQRERQRKSIVLGINIVAGALIVLGTLPPIACAWARITIESNPRGELCVRSRGILWRRDSWPRDHFDHITTWTMERYWFGQHSAVVGHAWEWIVQVSPRGLPSMPYVGDVAIASEQMGPQFFVDRQKHRPLENERAPEPVRAFVKALRALTDLPASPPQTVEVRLLRSWFRPRQVRRVEHPLSSTEPISTESYTFNSMDEIPPELRARMAEMLRSGEVTRHVDGTLEAVSHKVVRRDTFNGEVIGGNWDELPPEIREQIRRFRKNPN